ncbi:hypothetical protein GO300_01370 [Ralstonia solanacearum]|nr:hypothetical protein [Ralstonia solanacearum]
MYLLRVKLGLATASPTSRTCSSEAGMRALTDQVALKLCQSSKHMENKLTGCTTCLDPFAQTFEADASLLQFDHDLHEVGQTTANPIQSPHH